MCVERGNNILPKEPVKMLSGERHGSGAAGTPSVWVTPSDLQFQLILNFLIVFRTMICTLSTLARQDPDELRGR
jgi:hypothetical protein